MEKYILELISENNRVIIPNFGAFIVSKEQGASILFNNFLSFNDGLLVNYVAEKKGIDTIIATDQVFDYVDQLKKQLDESGEYAIDKLGVFKKDDNGILRFQQAEDFAEQLASSNKEEEVEDKEEIQETFQSEKETEKTVFVLETEEDEKTPDEIEKEEPIEESITANNEDEPLTEEKTIIPPSTSTIDSDNVEDNDDKKEPEEPAKEHVFNRRENKQVEQLKKDQKRNNLILLIVLTGIVVIVIGAYFLFFKKDKKSEPKVTKKEIIKPKPVTKPVVKDSIVDKPKVVKPKKQEEPKVSEPIVTKGYIHIIVGGFENENNAYRLVKKLKDQGHAKAQVIKKGNMHLVSIYSDLSYPKVEAKQQEVLNDLKMESWLYTIK